AGREVRKSRPEPEGWHPRTNCALFYAENARLNRRTEFLFRCALRPGLRNASRVACFGPPTPTPATRLSDASVDPTDARNAACQSMHSDTLLEPSGRVNPAGVGGIGGRQRPPQYDVDGKPFWTTFW